MLNATINNFHLYPMGEPENELAHLPAFGDHPKCSECPQALACGSGALPKILMVGRTREDHREGVTVKCIEDGKVKLVPPRYLPISEPETTPLVVTYPQTATGVTFTATDYLRTQHYVISNNSK